VAVGILFAVFLDGGARGLSRIVRWSRHTRLVILFVLIAGLTMLAIWWGGTILIEQANNFVSAMKILAKEADAFLQSGPFGLPPISVRLADFLPSSSVVFGGARTVASITFTVITLPIAILFLAAFLVWEPGVYKAMILSLLPRERRTRVNAVLDMAGHAMREWLIGQFVSMFVIFLFSLVALLLVGMRYPILLAFQAGLMTFVPTLGPLVAGVVIILAGLSQSFVMAIYGFATYLFIQFLESNLVTPLIQERTIRMPPATTVAVQLVAAFVFGLIGVAFVVPLSAAAMVLIEELYVKDMLGGGWHAEEEPTWLVGRFDRILNWLGARGG
jgi:predicted PurR-regulated permease PerM